MAYRSSTLCLALFAFLAFYASPVAAFGAGNIGKRWCQCHVAYLTDAEQLRYRRLKAITGDSAYFRSLVTRFDRILRLETNFQSRNTLQCLIYPFRKAVLTMQLVYSGDIEDMLKTVAFIKGHKWTSMMIKRVYFGNWLRDYRSVFLQPIMPLFKITGSPETLSRNSRSPLKALILTWRNTTVKLWTLAHSKGFKLALSVSLSGSYRFWYSTHPNLQSRISSNIYCGPSDTLLPNSK